jgi:hypothetical protein
MENPPYAVAGIPDQGCKINLMLKMTDQSLIQQFDAVFQVVFAGIKPAHLTFATHGEIQSR